MTSSVPRRRGSAERSKQPRRRRQQQQRLRRLQRRRTRRRRRRRSARGCRGHRRLQPLRQQPRLCRVRTPHAREVRLSARVTFDRARSGKRAVCRGGSSKRACKKSSSRITHAGFYMTKVEKTTIRSNQRSNGGEGKKKVHSLCVERSIMISITVPHIFFFLLLLIFLLLLQLFHLFFPCRSDLL